MHVKDVCKRLGKLGFASAAPDLYWQRKELLNSERIQVAMEDAWGFTLEERSRRSTARMARKGFGPDVLGVISTLYSKRFRDGLLSNAVSAVKLARSRYKRTAGLGFCLGSGLQ